MHQNQFEIRGAIGETIFDALLSVNAIRIRRSCGGKGLCRSCEVRLIEGEVEESGIVVRAPNKVRSCIAKILSEKVLVECKKNSFSKIVKIEDEFVIRPTIKKDFFGIGIAVDIGTTTVSSILCKGGNILAKASMLNAQTVFADDVLSRIEMCSDVTNIKKLQDAIVERTLVVLFRKMLSECDVDVESVEKVVISGNTTMLHLLLGIDPSPMGKIPFIPNFLDVQKRRAKDFFDFLVNAEMICLPSVSAYIGSDVVAGVYASRMNESRNSLLIDIGTNGEMVLKCGNEYYACSAAAGPAFEGYGLSCGSRAVDGAISEIYFEENRFRYKAINGGNPTGICGSGYIDFLAVAHNAEIISNAGRIIKGGKSGNIFLCENEEIFVSEIDIQNILKAKAAIHSSVKTLLEKFDLPTNDLDSIFIAGGFGKNINIGNAKACGLLPDFEDEKICYLGNSSLGGSYACLVDGTVLGKLSEIAIKINTISLNEEENFEDNFIDSLFL